jgi:hypothetical protein
MSTALKTSNFQIYCPENLKAHNNCPEILKASYSLSPTPQSFISTALKTSNLQIH